jgi:hypothetical protein
VTPLGDDNALLGAVSAVGAISTTGDTTGNGADNSAVGGGGGGTTGKETTGGNWLGAKMGVVPGGKLGAASARGGGGGGTVGRSGPSFGSKQ